MISKEKNIYTILSWGFGLCLAIVLLTSPCAVRNSITDAIGLEHTSVTSKSKSTSIQNQSCNLVDFQGSIVVLEQSIPFFLNFFRSFTTVHVFSTKYPRISESIAICAMGTKCKNSFLYSISESKASFTTLAI